MTQGDRSMASAVRPLVFCGLLLACAGAFADLSAIVAAEPTSKKEAFLLSRASMESALGRAIGESVTVSATDDLTDSMRATRSGGYDVFIAPAQVAASALSHGYELIGSTDPAEQYVLVGKARFESASAIKGGKLYLPQQDSIYTYMARGMLNASGLSFKDMGQIQYARYPQAGLTAISLGSFDATVIRRSEWEAWNKENPQVAKVLATSEPVPGGLSVVMRKSLPEEVRSKAAKWFGASSAVAGLKPVAQRAELADYQTVAELGFFTPRSLPGATVVDAAQVQKLVAQGAVIVDARNAKEYKAKRIPKAVFIPYVEKSLKDVAFDASKDDFSGIEKLDKSKPTIFACNGAECWKSYKASAAALQKGFKQVYWFRGGLPEWESAGLPVARD